MSTSSDPAPVTIVGAGAVGTALARALTATGHPVEAVLSRTATSAQALAETVGAPVAASSEEALPASVRLVWICVPDDTIASVAAGLAEVNHPWSDTIVAHTSGAKTAAALAPLAEQGAATMSFHPLQTFTEDSAPDAFEGTVVGLEGDDRAVAAGEVLAQSLGARPVQLTPEAKTLYHAAAALASNGLVALLAVVEEIFAASGSETDTSGLDLDAVEPLLRQTLENVQQSHPEGALTGPVARGDEETVQSHLEALTAETPHLVPLYTALSTELVRVAVRGGHLNATQAEALLATLREAADADANDDAFPTPSH
jgi:predicted short-subunit dehydrogenase-like oxidoreductase (DUF2520 family)